MSSHPSMPDSDLIEAWLAGELPDDQAAELEQYVEEHGIPDPEEAIETDLLRNAAKLTQMPAEVDALVEAVKTHHAHDMPAPSKNAWREILAPSENPEILGTLGNYEVLEIIATGGMGILLKARDPELNRLAALKVLSPELATNATARERFLREARAAAALEHENILPIYGIHAEAIPWFSMRYVAGGSLQDALDSDLKFDISRLKSIARQTASALLAAHNAGIIHRDIKPGNILLDEDAEKIWVCDFGIARTIDNPALTYAGSVAGTPQYMSPEQADGRALDGRSDLFSLGTVLYRCATGKHAFEGNTSASVLKNIATTEPVTVTQINTRLPAWFERLLANLLAKDPRDRSPSAGDVISSIDREYSPRPRHTARRRKRITAIVCAAIIGIIALQIPVVRNWTNAGFGKALNRPITVDQRLGTYTSLADAVESARDGDTLVLRGGVEFRVDRLQIPLGKSLSLTSSDPTNRPTLTTHIAGAPGIEAHSPLRITGIHFRINPKRDSDGIVILFNTTATIEDCSFIARRVMQNPYDDVKARAIDLHGNASVDLQRCDFDLEETNAITFFESSAEAGNASARVRECKIIAFYALSISNVSNPSHRLRTEFENSEFTGDTFLKFSSAGSMPSIDCRVTDAKLFTESFFAWFPKVSKRDVLSQFLWTGSGISHYAGKDKVMFSSTSRGKEPDSILQISLFGNSSRNIPSETYVELKETGQRFPDIRSAIAQIESSGTLLVSGNHLIEEIIYAEDTQSIRIAPVPGKPAIITSIDPMEHALFFRGPTVIEGITFRRLDPAASSLPIVGFLKSESVRIEDCHFECNPINSKHGVALGFTDVKNAIVRRCYFDSKGGSAILLAHILEATIDIRLTVEESIFVTDFVFEQRNRPRAKNDHASLSKCIAICDHFLTVSKNFPFDPLRVTLDDSLIDVRSSMFQGSSEQLESIKKYLSWTGTNNRHSPTTDLTSIPEAGSKSLPLFDRTKLGRSTSKEKLLDALAKDVLSPALQTFDFFQ
jgi:serine/threonine protein kinase